MVTNIKVGARGNRFPCTSGYRGNGVYDDEVINAAIDAVDADPAGGTVYLSSGRFQLQNDIAVHPTVNLIGRGRETAIVGDPGYVREIKIEGNPEGSYQTVRGFWFSGRSFVRITGSHVRCSDILGTPRDNWESTFHVAPTVSVHDIRIEDCHVRDTSASGFLLNRYGATVTLSDITFSRCSAVRCGHDPPRYHGSDDHRSWQVGFSCETADVLSNILFVDCYAAQCWESGFHNESGNDYNNVRFVRCISEKNGIRKSLTKKGTFNSGGTHVPTEGDYMVGATSGARGLLGGIRVTGGTWAGGDASGALEFEMYEGTFVSGENISCGGTSNVFTMASTPATADEWWGAGFELSGPQICRECVALDNWRGFYLYYNQQGTTSSPRLYRCREYGSGGGTSYLIDSGTDGAIMYKCTAQNPTGTILYGPNSYRAAVTDFQRIPAGQGTVNLPTGAPYNNVINYTDTPSD